jgi:hypothetical protein
VAGDPSLPVWDNATRQMAAVIGNRSVPGGMTRLSARREPGAMQGGLKQALERIAAMRPGPGEGCFVFLTMHGARDAGLVFEPGGQVLTPDSLDAALERGCGAAPTLVVASGCYTGGFATGRMARPNRVVMTAARADRSSFGCGAGHELTVFDDCLLRGLSAGGTIATIWPGVTGCVEAEERRRGYGPPSGPQLHQGEAARDIAFPVRPRAKAA